MDEGDRYLAYGRSGQAPQEMECLSEILNKRELFGPIMSGAERLFKEQRMAHTEL